MDYRHALLWCAACYAVDGEDGFAALAFRGWIQSVRKGWVVVPTSGGERG